MFFLGAPRGSGVKSMISEFAAMHVGSSSGRSTSRSVPYSSMSEPQPQVTEKRGKFILSNIVYFFTISMSQVLLVIPLIS